MMSKRALILPSDIIVGVPGAFTPPCSSQVPGYVAQAEQFAAKGVKGIYIVAVNDAFTTQAWKEKLGVAKEHPIVHFLADDTGAVSNSRRFARQETRKTLTFDAVHPRCRLVLRCQWPSWQRSLVPLRCHCRQRRRHLHLGRG